MPYDIKGGGGKRRFRIVRKADGKTVGTSTNYDNALASVRARMSGEKPKRIRRGY